MAIANLPYVHAAGDGGPRKATQMIVIHDTGNTASAEGEAQYATRRPDRTSAHVYVDGDSAVRALPLGNIAYGCHPTGNSRSVQFELVQSWTDATMRVAAPLVAEVCKMYGLPIRKISAQELRDGVKGICGHADVTLAWREGDHMDPGARFDWGKFIGLVAAAAGATVPGPAPAPVPAGRPAPGPAVAFPLPAGWYFGPKEGPRESISCQYGETFGGRIARSWLQEWANQLSRRGWSVGKGRQYLSQYGNDGYYGSEYRELALAFQANQGLTRDGLIGSQTWWAAYHNPVS